MARKLRPSSATESQSGADTEEPTKRGRSKAPEPAVQAATEEQKREAMDRLVEAQKALKASKAEHDKQRGKYRNAFKEAKKITGFTEDALSKYMKVRDADPHEIDAEVREFARVCNFMNLPVGFQSAFSFEAPKSDAALDEDQGALKAAEEQGYRAGSDGDRPVSNPYPKGSERNARWAIGYQRAQVEIGSRMGGGNGAHAAHA